MAAGEEIELIKRWRDGDRDAGDLLFRSLFYFVLTEARSFATARGIRQRDDVESWAVMGLLRAMEKYDERRGVRLISYAKYWIRQSMKRAWLEDRLIHIPIPILERQKHANPAYIEIAERAKTIVALPAEL